MPVLSEISFLMGADRAKVEIGILLNVDLTQKRAVGGIEGEEGGDVVGTHVPTNSALCAACAASAHPLRPAYGRGLVGGGRFGQMSNWSDSAYPDGQAAPSRGTSNFLVLGLAIVLVVGGIAAYVVFNDDSNPFAALLPAAAVPHSTASAPARADYACRLDLGHTNLGAHGLSHSRTRRSPNSPRCRRQTNLPFHVTMSPSVVSQTEGKAKVTLAVDMAGKDFAGKVTISRTGSQSVAGNVIVVNNGWFLQKSAQSAWEQHTTRSSSP